MEQGCAPAASSQPKLKGWPDPLGRSQVHSKRPGRAFDSVLHATVTGSLLVFTYLYSTLSLDLDWSWDSLVTTEYGRRDAKSEKVFQPPPGSLGTLPESPGPPHTKLCDCHPGEATCRHGG